VQIHDLNAVPKRIVKVATKRRDKIDPVLFRKLFANLIQLRLVAHNQTKVSGPVGLQLLHLEDSEELMLTDSEESVAFSFIHFLELEDILVKRHCFRHVVHLDRNVVDSVDTHTHGFNLLDQPSLSQNEFRKVSAV